MRLPRFSRLDAGIFLISFAVLLVELLLTRIFSVTMYYHLSFVVVSLAMLGFGLSGLLINLWPNFFRAEKMRKHLAVGALLFAATSVLVVGVAFRLPVSLTLSQGNLLRLALIYVLCVVPFVSGGLVVALLLTHRTEQANRLYFADLVGAATACLLFIPVTDWLGAPTGVLAAAAVAALAAFVFAGGEAPRASRVASVLCGALVLASAANVLWGFYDVRVTKGYQQSPMLALKWNSFSRVEVPGTPEDLKSLRPPSGAGFSSRLPSGALTTEVMLRYDADAATEVTRLEGDPSRLTYLRYDVASAPYHLRRFESVLILGSGGGRDILTALHMGNSNVTGVEINPLTVELMRGPFRDFTGGLYDNYPGVRVVNDEGRNFLRSNGAATKYDLIQASLVDTWAATAAGAYALAENNLYTVEAFEDYLTHLTPDGLLSFSRWYADAPVEVMRVVTLAAEALRRQGARDPAAHIFVVRTRGSETKHKLATILVKRSPFSPDELRTLRRWAQAMEFPVVYAPDDRAATEAEPNDFHQLLGARSAQFIADYPYELSAVYDDRPFFFDRVPLVAWAAHRLGVARSRVGQGQLTLGGQSLLVALVVSSLATALLLVLPLIARRGRMADENQATATGAEHPRSRSMLWALYFACLGLGFITVEIVLIQRFNLFFGYPVYSLTVVLFTMLAASGAGSFLAGRWDGARVLPRALAALCGVLAIYALALPRVLESLHGVSTGARIVLGVGVVAPLGLLMGMPFPTGLRRAGSEARSYVSWAWAVNGAASVFGSTLTMLVSMTYGFTASFVFGAAAYVLALCAITVLNLRVVGK